MAWQTGPGASAPTSCVPSATVFCVSVDPFSGENGYYRFTGRNGNYNGEPLPTLSLTVGRTYTFDQSDVSNWWHPLGFAFYPDGANGETWGAAARDEVERADQLNYLTNGVPASCPAHVRQPNSGDTGLDCYEPAFMDLRSEWRAQRFAVNLTITPQLAATSRGGSIYYFCHLHARMTGRIRLYNADGSRYVSPTTTQEDYVLPPIQPDRNDMLCGTVGTSPYHPPLGNGQPGGARACSFQAFGGTLDTPFEQCLQAIDCQMKSEMFSRTEPDPSPHDPLAKVRMFMQQMIPHHTNAIAMSRLMLKQVSAGDLASVAYDDGEGGDFVDLLWSILNTQSFQVQGMRHYLARENPSYYSPSPPPPTALSDGPAIHAEEEVCVACSAVGSPRTQQEQDGIVYWSFGVGGACGAGLGLLLGLCLGWICGARSARGKKEAGSLPAGSVRARHHVEPQAAGSNPFFSSAPRAGDGIEFSPAIVVAEDRL